jgi:hypothetical protein
MAAVTLTSNPGAANAFTLTTAIANAPALPWIYTVDFEDSWCLFQRQTVLSLEKPRLYGMS